MRKSRLLILMMLLIAQFTVLPQKKELNLKSKTGKEGRKPTAVLSAKGLSPQTALLLLDIKKLEETKGRSISENDTALIEKYCLINKNGHLYANVFVVHNDSLDFNVLNEKGIFVGSKVNGIITALIPVDKIVEITEVKGVKSVRIGEKGELQMDMAREKTWVDWVHEGYDLPQSFMGDGVVVGIIDNGFDYTHPNFYDFEGEHTRIKRVWEQNATTGIPPSGFEYGRELKTESEILNAQCDRNDMSHGSHVTGIAAGCGGTVDETYMGVAPKSDIVLVSTDMSDAGTAAGISYIFDYANLVNKPCVINMSLGKWAGPKDGTSTFDRYCDEIVESGNLLIGSAGNYGNADFHLEYDFYGQDTVFSFLKFYNGDCTEYGYYGTGDGKIDIWGESGKDLHFALNLYNIANENFEDWTDYYDASVSASFEVTLVDDSGFDFETNITIQTGIDALNNKPRAVIAVDNSISLVCPNYILLEMIGDNSTVNAWGCTKVPHVTTFSDLDYLNVWFGDPFMTVGEIGGTGNSIISVGAYTSKNQWINFAGNSHNAPYYNSVGDLAPFSSLGPTADGRIKPDITAPGNVIVSSVNSYDQTYTSNNSDVVYGVTDGSNYWWYATMQGTSMSAPVVTGIIALLLEKYPELTVAQVKQLLKDNAWQDAFTGNITSEGDIYWGWGKVDAHETMKDLISKIPNKPTISPTGTITLCEGESVTLSAPTGYSHYEWNNGATTRTITVSNSGDYRVKVKNSAGYESQWSDNKHVNIADTPATPVVTQNGRVLTSSALNGNQWYRNNYKISGATGRTYTVTQEGNYYTIVTNAYGCASDKSNIINVSFAGVDEYDNKGICIYPNPAKDKINVNFEDSASVQQELYLFDTSGRTVFSINIENQNSIIEIPLNNMPCGCYVLKIILQDAVVTRRIIVEK